MSPQAANGSANEKPEKSGMREPEPRDILEISAGREACEAELISTDQKAGGSEGWGFESLRARQLSPGAMRNSAPSV